MKKKITWAQTWALVAVAGWLTVGGLLWARHDLQQRYITAFQHQLARHP